MVYHTNNTIADYSDSTFGFKDFENTKDIVDILMPVVLL